MSAYTVKIVSNTQASVRVVWDPPKPASGIFALGDQFLFTSDQGPWMVNYPDSPFVATPNSGQTILGDSGEVKTMTAIRQGEPFAFDCRLVVGSDVRGWGTGGDQTPIRNPGGG